MTNREKKIAEIEQRFNLQNDNGHEHDLTNLEVQMIFFEIDRLNSERDKLIEGLRHYADERRYQVSWYGRAGEYTGHARDILKSIGIDV